MGCIIIIDYAILAPHLKTHYIIYHSSTPLNPHPQPIQHRALPLKFGFGRGMFLFGFFSEVRLAVLLVHVLLLLSSLPLYLSRHLDKQVLELGLTALPFLFGKHQLVSLFG